MAGITKYQFRIERTFELKIKNLELGRSTEMTTTKIRFNIVRGFFS